MSSKHHEQPHDVSREQNAAESAHSSVGLGGAEVPAKPKTEGVDSGATQSPDQKATNREAQLESELRTLSAEMSSLREELSQVNDKYLRKLADDANFRKRMAREKEDGQRFALAALLSDLIPILDDFDRAVASAETLRDYTVLHDGIVLIRRQLGTMLDNKYGLKRFDSLGKPFDPNHHEAVAMVTGDTDEAVVAEEFMPGYGLQERILRTAKVKVMMPKPSEAVAQATDTGSVDTAGAMKAPTDVEE